MRVTVSQRANYRQLPAFVALARELGARQVSFVAVDVANPHAFGRVDDFAADLALQPQDLPVLARILDDMERDLAEDFRSGLIAESPRKLRRLHQYFSAVCGLGAYPPVRCNVFDYFRRGRSDRPRAASASSFLVLRKRRAGASSNAGASTAIP